MTTSLRRSFASILVATLGIASAMTGLGAVIPGNYGGILEPLTSDPPENSGMMQVQVTSSGVISGVLIWQGQRYPFKGEIDAGKPFTHTFSKKTRLPADLEIFLTLLSPSISITGNFSEVAEGNTQVSLPINLTGRPPDPGLVEKLRPGLRISFIDPPTPTNEGEEAFAAESGVSELGPTTPPQVPGDGFVHVRISKLKKRATRMVGRLPDARGAFSAGSPLRGDRYAIYSSLYKTKHRQGGQLFGAPGVSESGEDVNLTSVFRWGKDVESDSSYYPGAFNFFLSINAVPYPKLKRTGALVPLLPQGGGLPLSSIEPFGGAPEPTNGINARILFRRGNISIVEGGVANRFFKQQIKIMPFHTSMVGDNPHKVKIQVDAFTGRFHGSFIHPVASKKTKFRGAFQAAVLFTPGQGRGHFRPPTGPDIAPYADPLESGGVRINVN